MIEQFSLEAEDAVIGAMLIQPHLISVISDDLSPDAFYYASNAELYRLILRLHDAGTPIDIVTLAEALPKLADGTPTMQYAGQIQKNTPSAANAKVYAQIVRDRAVSRQISDAAASIHTIASETMSAEDKVAQAQALILGLDAGGADVECQMVGDILRDHVDVLEGRHERAVNGILVDGLKTGLPDLDDYTAGLKGGQMIVIAGRPAMGKTTLAMNIAADVGITQGKACLVISLEMSKGQLMDRLLAAVGGISLKAVKNGSCCHNDDDSAGLALATLKLRDAPIAVSDLPVMTMPRIRSVARRQSHKMGGLGLIVVDYLGLVEGDGKGRVDDVTTMSRQIKLLARELDVPVVILCQLNRSCEARPDKRPVLSDLRESGAIEQDADIVMFVYRDEVYYPSSEYKGIGELG